MNTPVLSIDIQYTCLKDHSGRGVKLLPVTQTFHIRVLVQVPADLFMIQLAANTPGKAETHGPKYLRPVGPGKTWVEFQDSGLLWLFEEDGKLCLSLLYYLFKK